MQKVCSKRCKESSDLKFRGKLKAIHIAFLIIIIVLYFQKKCDIDILTIFENDMIFENDTIIA